MENIYLPKIFLRLSLFGQFICQNIHLFHGINSTIPGNTMNTTFFGCLYEILCNGVLSDKFNILVNQSLSTL